MILLIQTSIKDIREIKRTLNSIMILLIPAAPDIPYWTTVFKFHYDSINSEQ